MASYPRSDLTRRTAIESMLHVVETVRARLRSRVERAGVTPEELAILRALAAGAEVEWEGLIARTGLDADTVSTAVEALVARSTVAWIRGGDRETIAVALTCTGAVELARADRALHLDPPRRDSRDEKPAAVTGDPTPRAAER